MAASTAAMASGCITSYVELGRELDRLHRSIGVEGLDVLVAEDAKKLRGSVMLGRQDTARDRERQRPMSS